MAQTALVLVAATLAIRGTVVTAQPSPPEFVHVAPLKDIKAALGGTATIVLKITIDKGYHLQGNNAKDPYIPTTATITAPAGITIGKIVYPPSVKKEFTGETLPVYESKIEIKIPITIAKSVKPGDLKLPITVNYQGCNDKSCYPPTKLSTTAPLTVSK